MSGIPQLRYYQQDLADSVSRSFYNGIKYPLVQLETGGGKTCLAGSLSMKLASQFSDGCACLYLVHRRELVEQVYQTLCDFGLGQHVGLIQSGVEPKPWALLQVASVQSLVRRLHKYPWLKPRVIFIDEAHHIRAATWETILNHYHWAYRIGLTATPARLDGKGLGEWFEVIIEGPSTRRLIDDGHLCEMDCFSIPTNIDFTKLKKAGGDYAIKDRQSRSTPKFRADIVENYLKYCMGRRVIHYANSVDDSIQVVSKLTEIGVKANHVDGKTPLAERKAILQAFGRGEIDCLSNYEIITEGFDCPECDAIIISRITASVVLFRQMLGRGRRPKKDGRSSILLDLVGNLSSSDGHGDPDQQPVWSLEDGIVDRAEGDEKKLSEFLFCDECGFLYPRKHRSCPSCGSGKQRQTIEDVQIELKELKKKERDTKRMHTRNVNRAVWATMGDRDKLRAIARENSYNPHVVNRWIEAYSDRWEAERERLAKIEEIPWL